MCAVGAAALARVEEHDEASAPPAGDRRAHERLELSDLPWLKSIRLKYGPDVSLINLSAGGAQVETRAMLRPGSTVIIELDTSGRELTVASRVVRCHIAALAPSPLYRGALEFARALELPAAAARQAAPPRRAPEALKVVVRYVDGRRLKGYTSDFLAAEPSFHLVPALHAPDTACIPVSLEHLKAVFFVRDFAGDPSRVEVKTLGPAESGRRVAVTFVDGEKLVGTTHDYQAENSGFMLAPADPQSNNIGVFVIASAVRHVEILDGGTDAPPADAESQRNGSRDQ